MSNKKEELLNEKNLTVHMLNVYDGLSLFNFVLEYGKYDLIIASEIFNHAPSSSKRRNSARFIQKHLLNDGGLFCIITPSTFEEDLISLLSNTKPLLKKTIRKSEDMESAQITFFMKTNPYITIRN